MQKIYFLKLCVLWMISMVFSFHAFAETVGVFYDSSNEQIKFAAGDLKTALESKGHTAEMLALTSFNDSYANKKVVVALASDIVITSLFSAQGGTIPTGLGQQAYELKTTTTSQKSFWVFGGDANGAMYGTLQLAENIQSDNLAGTYSEKVSPDFIQRGVKLNLPLDKKIPTYSGYMNPTSAQYAITSVWDMSFWTKWIDQQARNRYNVLSVWVHHPFPALVKVPGYEKACLPAGIEGYFGFANPNLTHDKRVEFWKQVMTYAHNRGFQFYFFCWNICLDYAKDQYPTLTDVETNTATIDYLSKSMKALLETYPELDGFGISAGDNMSSPKDDRPAWTWKAYGKAAYDYAIANPDRKFTIIHRGLGTALTSVYKDWSPLTKLPNFKFDYSVKYANAHMFSTLTPKWYDSDMQDAAASNQKTWLTLRNDDFFYMDMGDPEFVRGFLKGVPYRQVINSFYMGSDLYMPTRAFFCKDAKMNGQLEIERNWYIQMLWGRISYNKLTSDAVFKNQMAKRFPQVSSETMFNAWALAARSLPKVQELTQATWNLDAHWYAEGSTYPCNGGNFCFRYLNDFLTTEVARASSSNLCSIASSAAGTCGTAKTTYKLADEMEADAQAALALIAGVSSQGDASLEVKINNIKQLAYLSTHFAYKIRAATYLKAAQTANARDAMGQAYCWWIKYSSSMDAMYNGNKFRTVEIIPNWRYADAWQLKDYTDLGGVGTPVCAQLNYAVNVSANPAIGGSVSGGGIIKEGTNVTVVATPNQGFRFVGWQENSQTVSASASYSFVLGGDRNLVAIFKGVDECDLPWSDVGLTVNKATVSKTYGPINISCYSNGVNLSLSLEGVGVDASDYCRIQYKVDGGALVSLISVNGLYAKKTVVANGIKGNALEIVVTSYNSFGDEFYYITNIKVDVPTANSLNSADDFEVFPNPASKILNISFPDNLTYRDVRIITSLGQVVYSEKTNNSKMQLDVQSLKFKGMGTIQVETDKKVINRKILVQ